MAGNFDAKTDPLAPTHPIAPKFFLVVDKKVLNTGCGADEYAWLLRTGRALDARAEPGIKSADVHDETEAQRLFLGVALAENSRCAVQNPGSVAAAARKALRTKRRRKFASLRKRMVPTPSPKLRA